MRQLCFIETPGAKYPATQHHLSRMATSLNISSTYVWHVTCCMPDLNSMQENNARPGGHVCRPASLLACLFVCLFACLPACLSELGNHWICFHEIWREYCAIKGHTRLAPFNFVWLVIAA
jgi:hypothetical protein